MELYQLLLHPKARKDLETTLTLLMAAQKEHPLNKLATNLQLQASQLVLVLLED